MRCGCLRVIRPRPVHCAWQAFGSKVCSVFLIAISLKNNDTTLKVLEVELETGDDRDLHQGLEDLLNS